MTIAATSIQAYSSSKATIDSVRDQVLGYIATADGPVSAFDVGDTHEALHPEHDTDTVSCFRQMIHSSINALKKAGDVIQVGTTINRRGKVVNLYAINNGINKPIGDIKRPYKERFEELEEEHAKLKREHALLQEKVRVLENDSVPKDTLADAYYTAQASGDFTKLPSLFVRVR